MTTVQVRVDTLIKSNVEKILANMGLDMSTAIRIYLQKIQQTNSIPFALSNSQYTKDGFTQEEEKEIISSWKESKIEKNRKKFTSMDDAINHLSNI